MTNAQIAATVLAERYLALWNEADGARRRRLISTTWAAEGRYVDPMMGAEGHEAIDGMIAAVQEKFPGLCFSLAGTPDGYGDRVRFSWALGPAGGPAIAHGTDFAELDGEGRFVSVTGFLDALAA